MMQRQARLPWRRVAPALCIAPFIPGMALGIAAFIAEGLPGQAAGLLVLIALYLVFSLPVALPAAVALLLLVIAYRRLGWDDWWRFGLGGAVIGWLSVFILAAVFESPSLTASDGFEFVGVLYGEDALLMALSGAGAGLVYWFMAYGSKKAVIGSAVTLAVFLVVLLGIGELFGPSP